MATASRPATGAERCVRSRRARLLVPLMCLAVVVGSGCATGPEYARPALDPPPAFKSPVPDGQAAVLPEDWWRLYNDPELDRLIALANQSNQDLRRAVAAFDQARALARVAASYRAPLSRLTRRSPGSARRVTVSVP